MTATAPQQMLHTTITHRFAMRKRRALAVPVLIVAYLIYVFFAFDLAGLAGRARLDNGAILLKDFWSYKTHVTRDNRSGEVSVAVEGERKGTYPAGQAPDWVTLGAVTNIALPGGAHATYDGPTARLDIPDFGRVTVAPDGRQIVLTLPDGAALPDWISAAPNRVDINRGKWRFSMTKSRTEVFRYQPGWELFFFTIDSPFHGKSLGDMIALALWEPRLDATQPNIVAMANGFWTNRMWHHDQVFGALGETVLMAFLGTMGAGLIAFPLAFFAASNFAPARSVRLLLRRLFDFLRGVDGLIWTVILSRAFGPGPLTGSLAILMTDTGTFGKTFSEALENIDGKQVEGIASTGATTLQRARFGVIPQVAPVVLSQLLYYLESNTRSATVIGALVGGGIGLLLTQAIITQKDWEEVCYYMILIVLMVMVMDSLSGWIRRRFIKG
ncbi:MAG: phosphonate ABC transporter, permease protein PhnE [Paracoccaceae bacterium]|nr:phosphonate ABC transporter, permease protein PhnE [Paracoccaceae bacterium]